MPHPPTHYMNWLIETLNAWADQVLCFAWPMLWQSSLLIVVLLTLDWLLRLKVRPAVRYALWLVVLVKLLLPPSLAFPTSIGWWLRSAKAPPTPPRHTAVVVTYGAETQPALPTPSIPVLVAPPPPRLSPAGWAFIGMAGVSLGMLTWMLVRWRQVAREAGRSVAIPDWVSELLPELTRPGRLRLTAHPQSPAVCGLFRPVILLPRALVEQLPPAKLRTVLLHEWFHLRRRDVWVNCA
jgi:beta-lactamase regulating signal transducer with metallopeptidase domain